MVLSKKVKERIKNNKMVNSLKLLKPLKPIEYNPFNVGDVLECQKTYPFGESSRWDLFLPGSKYVVSNTIGSVVYIDDMDGDSCEFYIHPLGLSILSKVFKMDHILREIKIKEIENKIRLTDENSESGHNHYIVIENK